VCTSTSRPSIGLASSTRQRGSFSGSLIDDLVSRSATRLGLLIRSALLPALGWLSFGVAILYSRVPQTG
jgi:hypothetical protein